MLAEGGLNRSFLITMRDGFQMVAGIPYTVTTPKYFAVAIEVATMSLLCSTGLPRIPEIYGYAFAGQCSRDRVYSYGIRGRHSVEQHLDCFNHPPIAELESKCQLLSRLAEACTMQETWRMWPGIPLEDERFCVGLDTGVYGMAVDHIAHRSRTVYASLKLTDNYR